LLVDHHAAVREAIAAMFERAAGYDVVGQAASLAEARPLLHDVDVAVVDLGLPDGFGGELIKELREVNPRAQALVLSAGPDRGELARAIESGAAGTLDKTAGLHEVVEAVRRLRAGEMLVPLDEVVELLRLAARERDRERDDRQAIDSLSPREREVLQLLAQGLDSKDIAARLNITLRTERNHVASIFAKLGVHSRLQAVVFALRHGSVDVR
jgi:DNA-binding NarL/FixJ family response regulator